VTVEANRWFCNGDHPADCVDLKHPNEGKVVRYFRSPDQPGHTLCSYCDRVFHEHGWIDTPEGGHTVCPGDWVITGPDGEHYPCKPRMFEKVYEPVAAGPEVDCTSSATDSWTGDTTLDHRLSPRVGG